MKPNRVLAIVPVMLFCLTGTLFSLEPGDFFLSIKTDTEFGQLGEYVFGLNSQTSHDDILMSRITWGILPAVFSGFEGRLQLGERFFANVDFSGAIPTPSGSVENKDWIAGNDPLDIATEEETHYSLHDAYLRGAFTGEIYFGWDFRSRTHSIAPLLGFTSMYYNMDARDGYGVYPVEEMDFVGTVISYRQWYNVPYVGIQMKTGLEDTFHLQGTLKGSVFAFINAVDHHYRRERLGAGDSSGLEFYDTFYFKIVESNNQTFWIPGIFLEANLRAEWDTSNNGSIWFSIGGTWVPPMQGNSLMLDTSDGTTSENENGAGAGMWMIRLTFGTSVNGWLY